MKQQSDKMLFGLLSNLTNCLKNSLQGKANDQGKFKFNFALKNHMIITWFSRFSRLFTFNFFYINIIIILFNYIDDKKENDEYVE